MGRNDHAMAIGFMLALAGLVGVGQDIEYSGWLIFVGLLICWCKA